jgi:hypothetical protein
MHETRHGSILGIPPSSTSGGSSGTIRLSPRARQEGLEHQIDPTRVAPDAEIAVPLFSLDPGTQWSVRFFPFGVNASQMIQPERFFRMLHLDNEEAG